MDETVIPTCPVATVEEIQKDWHELKLRVGQLEVERGALEHENKTLRALLERVIEHRQKSHGELVILLTSLVAKLPINDIGVVISKLVEHNAHVSEMCTALVKGKPEAALPQPTLLKELDQTRRELAAALKPAVEELIQLDPPLDQDLLRSLIDKPELFFSPGVVRANRCFVKGHLPHDRIVREFGADALSFFNDLTTDSKRNPRPKPEEIVLSFKNDFDALLQQNSALPPEKRAALLALHQKVQRSKAVTDQARAQKNSFYKLSFLLELLHYYENQNTEAPDVIFASRLPVLIEQFVIPGAQDPVEEKLVLQAEGLLAHILSPDHRLMVVNNVGKTGEAGKTLKFLLRFRVEKTAGQNPVILNEVIPDFIKHLISPQKPPAAPALAVLLRLLSPDLQRIIVRAIMVSDRLRKETAETLGRALGKELNLTGLEEAMKVSVTVSLENERQIAWETIKGLITSRAEPGAIATAMRDRLHARYDADEVKQSWITLTEADPISLIRVFCQMPYLADGRTDPVARAVMETYVTRLTHEKYAATYHKVVNSLKNMFNAKPDSPTLLNFVALVKWVDAAAAQKLSGDIGMPH
jgi:hypothetical protein